MNTKKTKGQSPQKTPTYVKIILVLVILGVLYFFLKPQNNVKLTSEDFKTVNETAYTFYYPKNYAQASLGEGQVLNYQNQNTKAIEAEVIFLKIESVDSELPTPTYESCLEFAELMRQTADDTIKVEVANGGFGEGNGVGCKISIEMPISGVNDSGMIIQKTLWDKTEGDNKIYTVRAIYYSNASKDEASKLDLAVDQFTLK